MGYQFWPSGLPPYTPYTYVQDRVTPLNHYSIMNGLARDIGALQHNINTTHLFASGYARPATSGFFVNIDTNYLYAYSVIVKNTILHEIENATIETFDITKEINANNAAFINNNIVLNGAFKSTIFSLDSNGLVYDPAEISGGLYNFYFKANDTYRFVDGLFGQLIVNSGNINLNANHKVIIENMTSFAPSGSISESGIIWNSNAGHNHINNKINAIDVVDSDLTINGDLTINSSNGSIDIISGTLDAATYQLKTYYEPIDFYVLDFAGKGTYTCDRPNLTGNVVDLDLGTSQIISYDDKVFATSLTPPAGLEDLTKTYLYYSNDLYNWTGVLASGSSWTPGISGLSTFDAFTISNGSLYVAWNCSVASGNYSHVMKWDPTNFNNSGIFYNLGAFAHGSSRYLLGLASIENALMTFGYEYPHVYGNGIPKWDKYCAGSDTGPPYITTVLYSGSVPSLVMEQDTSFKSNIYKYSYPFVQCFKGDYTQKFWIDGTYNDREPYLTLADNGDVYNMMPRPVDPFSGYFGGLFGNGFSEVTAMLSTNIFYHNGDRGVFTERTFGGPIVPALLSGLIGQVTRNEHSSESPILIFGSASTSVDATSGTIFGGCIPLIYDLDKRMLPQVWSSDGGGTFTNIDVIVTSGNADYAPMYLNGSRSLMSNIPLFRIPAYNYCTNTNNPSTFSLCESSLASKYYSVYGMTWTDFSSIADQRTELINFCPSNPGLLVFPFGGSGCTYYKNIVDVTPVKLDYVTFYNTNGIIIPPSSFSDVRNYPIFKEKPKSINTGFWKEKQFNWYYQTPNFDLNKNIYKNPSDGVFTPTYYYMRPKCPIQLNGSIYNILEFNSGFVYTGPNGSEYIDDNIYYSDLVKFGTTLYGVGVDINNNLKLTIIKRTISSEVKVNATLSGTRYTPKFLIHRGKLYVGIGNGRFLVKKPSHLDFCITSNL